MLLFLDSFDHYNDADVATKWTQTVAGTNDTSSIGAFGRRSTRGCALDTIGDFPSRAHRIVLAAPAPSGATAIAGFAFKCVDAFSSMGMTTTQTSGPCLCSFYSGGAQQIWFRLNDNGTISAYRGSTLLGTSASALTQNVYQYLEFKVLLSDTVGTVLVRVDGATFLSLTGQDTTNTTGTAWDEFYLGPTRSSQWNIDDLYVCDGSGADGWTDVRGDVRIDAVYPNANGTNRNWTPNAGTDDFAVTDEALANGDTDYLASSVVGDKVTMNYPNAPVTGAAIYGVQLVAQTRKTDAGGAGQKAITRISGTDYLGTERAPSSAYSFLREAWGVRPSDGVAWSESVFNAAEFGVQKST